ncbi:MAG: DUF1573 domain-containing protein [Desulfobacteraceae bacterium]|nr:hypothetical protein [Desulfobacteraceae bacterium]MBC2754752.1 DUF1573 domain-containing protein [Desulfobacteraceae bacterium]
MKLKTGALITALVCFLIITLNSYTGAKEPAPSPRAIIKQTTFEFPPVIAGTEVTHLFSISNKGNAPLNIPGVYAG